MHGDLFLYDPQHKLVAFESGALSSPWCFILIGGLTDGLLSLPYVERLSSALQSLPHPHSLIQPLFRSSNLQYGWHTIDDDVEDLQRLIEYVLANRNEFASIVLMGHSTGCQDIIHYLRQKKRSDRITRVILQGPVSDRQYLCRLRSTKDQMEYCLNNAGNSRDWLPRDLHDPPLSVQRCLSFNQAHSIEDLFSSDLTDEQIKGIYHSIETPIAWICSSEDEYVPDDIKQDVQHFIQNKLAKQTHGTFLLLDKADHAVTGQQEQMKMIEHIVGLLLID